MLSFPTIGQATPSFGKKQIMEFKQKELFIAFYTVLSTLMNLKKSQNVGISQEKLH